MLSNDAPTDQLPFTKEELQDLIANHLGPDRVPRQLRIIIDTTDFFRVDYDDVVILGRRPFLIRNNEREGRFGIDDEQKFWVKRAIDLMDGTTKILKLTFHERFLARVGELHFECFRSPQKEARILDIVKGHSKFMQGFSMKDSVGNVVRIIDYITGRTMADSVMGLGLNHEDYFYRYFPSVLDEYIELVAAIKFLHEHGEKHGDIRRDHILKDKHSGECRWIDFDFNYLHKENMFGYDLFGLGNILAYLTGRGDVTDQQLKQSGSPVFDQLTKNDMNIIFKNRVVNLKKVYPYIPEALNFILLHFSMSANIFYEDCDQLLADLHEIRKEMV